MKKSFAKQRFSWYNEKWRTKKNLVMKFTRNSILTGLAVFMLASTSYGTLGETNLFEKNVRPAALGSSDYRLTASEFEIQDEPKVFSKVTYNFQPDSVTTNVVWSMSGNTYSLAEYAVFADPFVWKNVYLTFPVVAGLEVEDQVPVTGMGVTLKYVQNRLFVEGGLYAIFGQKQKPDVTFGFSAGVRF